jgi:hypothetical protein
MTYQPTVAIEANQHVHSLLEERRLLSVLERFLFDAPSDLWQLIPPTLPDPFETSHLALALGHPRWFAQKIAYCLRQSGVITAIGKKGNSLVYSRLAPSATGLDNEATGRTSAMAPMASNDARLITPPKRLDSIV